MHTTTRSVHYRTIKAAATRPVHIVKKLSILKGKIEKIPKNVMIVRRSHTV